MRNKFEQVSDEKLEKRIARFIIMEDYRRFGWFFILLGLLFGIPELLEANSPDLTVAGLLLFTGCLFLVNALNASMIREYLGRKGIVLESIQEIRDRNRRMLIPTILLSAVIGLGLLFYFMS